ncbi:MAG: hypothetical protein I8H98_09250 [Moraxellaceae bacterium]|nr:hypothetical protein [Moraxellaceae bacterium]
MTTKKGRDAIFLSCLHSSEPVVSIGSSLYSFLSCLHGSERGVGGAVGGVLFLSCLHGSERCFEHHPLT